MMPIRMLVIYKLLLQKHLKAEAKFQAIFRSTMRGHYFFSKSSANL